MKKNWPVPLLTAIAGAAILASSACSGSGNAVPIPPRAASREIANAGSRQAALKVKVRLSVVAQGMRPAYLSPGTKSIAILEDGKSLGNFNVGASSGGCTSARGGTACVFDVSAVAGANRVFTIKAYDLPGAAGRLLSSAKVVQTIATSGTQTLAVTLSGVVKSIAIGIAGATIPAGAATKLDLVVMAKDADGYTIVGSERYNSPITLALDDSMHATKLSSHVISSPADRVALSYSGAPLTQAVVSASAKGVSTTAVTPAILRPTPAIDASFALPTAIGANGGLSVAPQAIVSGIDGNLWLSLWSDGGQYGLAKMTTDGTFSVFAPGEGTSASLPNSAISSLALASDNKVWYLSEAPAVGSIDTSGNVTNYAVSGNGICADATLGDYSRMVPAEDGGLWFGVGCAAGPQLIHVSMAGVFDAEPLNASNFTNPQGLVIGKDHKLYLVGYDTGAALPAVLQVTVSGAAVTNVVKLDIAGGGTAPETGIAQSTDGDLWMTSGACNPSIVTRLHLSAGFAAASLTNVQTLAGCAKPAFLFALPDNSLWVPQSSYASALQVIPQANQAAPLLSEFAADVPTTVRGAFWDAARGSDGYLYITNFGTGSASPVPFSSNVLKVAY